MRSLGESFRLSATDLSNHLHCHHLTGLNLSVARGERERPDWYDPRAEVLRERGYEHEKRYLEQLKADGRQLEEVTSTNTSDLVDRTIELMREGVEVVAQGALADDGWFGRPDVLLRVEGASDLGPWSYEVLDTKLARETRGATVLQLCLYSELVAAVQGKMPEKMYVVSPADVLAPETLRVTDYLAYQRWIKRRLQEAVAAGSAEAGAVDTYPEPVEHCQVCAYWKECDDQRRMDDHLSLVAGASRSQRRELESRSIETLARLAEEPIPLAWKPTRGAVATYERTREQARVQLEGRKRDKTYYELLEVQPEKGLARLPEPEPADVFFDFEGDAFVGTGGLEYLFGWVTLDGTENPAFSYLWADDAESEKLAFEQFVDEMIARLEANPGFHIYHFTPYEPSALKRLMGRYATREVEIDRLLRGKVMVDLHSVTRQALRAAVERYSLKELEGYCGFDRKFELREAKRVILRVERMLELGRGHEISVADRDSVLAYNRDDCFSTLQLRDWLESLRAAEVADGKTIERPGKPEDEASEDVQEHAARVGRLVERLTQGVPVEEGERSTSQHASWLLAHVADYHRREMKVKFWDKFRLQDMVEEELLDDPAGISRLELEGEVPQESKRRNVLPIHRYRFPLQEVKFRRGAELRFGDCVVGKLAEYDTQARTIDVKKTGATVEVHPPAVFQLKIIRPDPKPEALLGFAEEVIDTGWEVGGPGRAARDLMLRNPPRVSDAAGPIGDAPGEMSLAAAKRLAAALERGVLPIQGPPGSGKTYTGARMALELVRQGKRVGVSATGHAVMRNFLGAALEAAEEEGVELRCGHKDKPEGDAPEGILVSNKYPEVRKALEDREIQILAGSSWLWAREDFAEAVDVLFIDEAGQMSLADVLVCARGAESLVLLGDPQQLDQPQQGSHPDGTHVSALEHLLQGQKTLQDGAGLFLGETYRLHPNLCNFTSEVFYEERLKPVAGLEKQLLAGPLLDGAGLWYLPVEHEGNQSASAEEVEVVGRLVERLVDGTTEWTDKKGETDRLSLDQVLIVAPYNAQVDALKERLPGARIGTVDKFQGREAPVVIFSTGTSSPDLAPRGMEFLYDSSRLNVATSRALSGCILVGSPRIFEPECRTPRQMKLANAFCRFLEVARTLALA